MVFVQMRTHPSSEYKYPEYDRLNRRQKDDLQRVPNRERRARLERIRSKPWKIHSERGIDLTQLPSDSVIHDIVRRRRWERFIRHPAGYDPDVVEQFFANMHPPTFLHRKTVMMGRIQVQITPQIICDFYGVPSQPALERTFGLADDPVFQISYNGEIAASLRRNGSATWDSQRDRLLKSDLHQEIGFLMLFVKTNLKPSTFCTAADELVADVLYSLQNNLPLDIGTIIWLEMMDTGHSLSRVLPFPCLITALCRAAGVPVRENLTKPMAPYGRRLFTYQETSGNRREQSRHGNPIAQGEEEFQDPDYESNQEEPAYQQPQNPSDFQQHQFQPHLQQPVFQQHGFQQLPPYQQPQYPFTEETPQYITQLFQGMQLGWASTNERLDIVNNNMQFMNNNMHSLYNNVQYLNQRMDWEGFPRTDEEAMGDQRRRRRRHDGASGSGSGHGHASSSHQEN